MDLFASRADDRLAREAPLATRVRPRTLADMVGQDHLLGPDGPLRKMAEAGRLHSMVVWGPPGVGKTTLARVLAAATDAEFMQLSATSAGVKDVREVLEGARRRLGENGRRTVLFLDEIHRFSRSQQDALLPGVEEGVVTLIGATTENPYFEVNSPLLSRASLFRLEPLTEEDVAALVRRAAAAPHGLDGWEVHDDAVHHLADKANGDVRQALNALELAATLAGPGNPVTLALAEEALQRRAVVYDKSADQHYDMVSAFIKSMRGSDPDASLYYLRRMLGAGEDPEFLARRMVILASEDIGNADPQALLVAVAAANALSFVGLPEAEINLSQAALYLASAPKSNAVIAAMGAVGRDLEDTRSVAPPAHLRDTHYRAAARLGHGKGYRYPHDHPDGVVAQQYLPDPVAGHVYYRPTRHGAEADVADRLADVDRAMGRDADRRPTAAE